MTNAETPRFTVAQRTSTRFVVRDHKHDQDVTGYSTQPEAQAKADAKNQLDALGIKAGDTVTGTTTGSHPRRITVTVDREPWTSGTRHVILSDGKSVEAVELTYLTVHDREPADAVSTDPAVHSIHIEGGENNRTIEPVDTGESCRICGRTYRKGQWRLLLPDVHGSDGLPLHMHRDCAEEIGAAVAHFPATPAPFVLY